ncbi:MAG: GNAT family N-acetyltransferase [Anaerovoracaceae bacterium]|nr:GNAT family N-acetyltransferase [Anaerovoracaceae bacterium]
MSDALIREATPDDAPRLREIYGYYVENTVVTFEYETPTIAEFRGRIEKVIGRFPYLAAERDGKIIGFAYAAPLRDRRAYDWSSEVTIYIDKDERRSGTGRLLYGELERRLRDMGILNLYACVGYADEEYEYLSWDSPKFHRRLGFETVAELHNCGYKFGRWYHMIWMEKIIGDHVPGNAPERKKNSEI